MARIKAASAMTAIAASLVVGGAILSNAIGGQNAVGAAAVPASIQSGQSSTTNTVDAGRPLRIGLENGTHLEVVAVSNGTRFWTADGNPLEEPAFEIPRDDVPKAENGWPRLYVKLAFVGELPPNEVPDELAWAFSPIAEGYIAIDPTMMRGLGGGTLLDPNSHDGRTLIFWFNVNPQAVTATLKLRVAAEPWRHGELKSKQGVNGLLDYVTAGILPEGFLAVTPIAGVPVNPGEPPRDGGEKLTERSQVTIATNQRTTTIAPILRDWDGKWHYAAGGTSLASDTFYVRTFVANMPPENVAAVALITRTTHHVDVDIVAVPEPQPDRVLGRSVKPAPRNIEPTKEAEPRE